MKKSNVSKAHIKTNNSYCLLLLIPVFLFSCEKFVTVNPPKFQLASEVVFKDSTIANSAIAGIYSQMYALNVLSSTFGGYGLTIQPGLSADELTMPASSSNQFLNNDILPANADLARIWTHCYNVIFMANDAIERLTQSNTLSPKFKDQLSGEVYFIRAISHFYLVNLFGDVPLVLKTDYLENSLVGRVSKDKIYEQIITDLLKSKELTVNDYSTYFAGEKVRVNKCVAGALLARVYLYNKQYELALDETNDIIERSDLFSLEAECDNVFLKNSTEAIFQFVSYGGDGATYLGNRFNLFPSSSAVVPPFTLTENLLNSFEEGDKRRLFWTKEYIVNNKSYVIPYKYKFKIPAYVQGVGEYDMVLRLPEQLLVNAESNAFLGRFEEARNNINLLRRRAGLSDIAYDDLESLLAAIEQERRVEYFAEWGHRWLDLKRTERTSEVLGNKPGWKNTAVLYPIPLIELNNNPNLHQNPGYN